jgi:hypothetical protein
MLELPAAPASARIVAAGRRCGRGWRVPLQDRPALRCEPCRGRADHEGLSILEPQALEKLQCDPCAVHCKGYGQGLPCEPVFHGSVRNLQDGCQLRLGDSKGGHGVFECGRKLVFAHAFTCASGGRIGQGQSLPIGERLCSARFGLRVVTSCGLRFRAGFPFRRAVP